MQCSSCGSTVPEGAAFCTQCGASLAGAQPQSVPGAQPYAGTGAQPGAQAGPRPYAGTGAQPNAQQGVPHPYGAPAQQPPMPPTQTVYAEGCISAALADLRAAGSWLGKTILLGLIMCVPILNFVAYGYMVNWAREVPFGGRTSLPKSIVNGKNFEIGFYVFLVNLVFGLVSGVVSFVLGLIPLIGWIATIAVSFALSMFSSLCCVRLAMFQQLGEGFKVSSAWNVMKRNWTSLFCAAVVPELVVGIIVSVLAVIVGVVVGVSVAIPAAMAGSVAYSGNEVAFLLSMVGGMGAFGVLLLLVFVVVCMVCSTIAAMVAYRAVAHWVGRYAPEWVSETYQAAGYGAPRY